MTLKVESKIHNQPRVAREMGAAHGIKMRKRTRSLPRNFLSKARARMLPRTMTRTCETKVNTKVFQSARRNTGFLTTLAKFWRPTKEKSRLPAEELVRLRKRARTKGGGEEQLAQSSIAWRQGIRGGEERCGASRLCSFHESQTQADRWTRLRSRIRLSA